MRHELRPPPRYVVYRLFRRTDGVLIYVGSTGRWGLRMSQHEREQWWWSQVGDMKLQDCASEREALVIEDIAIKREKPLHNKRVNFAERKAAIAADENAYMVGEALMFMIPMLYLLGRWAYRGLRWQVDARRALLTGGEIPGKVANPFFEDSTANRFMLGALAAPSMRGKLVIPGQVSGEETCAEPE